MTLKLTEQNYFTPENRYLSNSKISDWLKDKRYFYNRHIERTVEDKKTDALIIGNAVDTWLTVGRAAFEALFVPVERRNLKNPPEGVIEITPSMHEQIVGVCENVERQAAYQFIRQNKFSAQQILQYDMDLGLFLGICGKPDWFMIDGQKAMIVDLKTTSNIDPLKYHYSCLEYGYYRQAAMYQLLIEYNFGVKECKSYHLAVEKDIDGIFFVQTFILDPIRLDIEKSRLFNIFTDIRKEKEFLAQNVSWDDSILIGKDMGSGVRVSEGFSSTGTLPQV